MNRGSVELIYVTRTDNQTWGFDSFINEDALLIMRIGYIQGGEETAMEQKRLLRQAKDGG